MPRVSPARKATFRELYDTEVEKNAPKLVKALIRASLRGDSRAQVDLANRVLGKPKDTVELSGPGGAPLSLQLAAPVALALMTTEELRALAALNRRLGVPDQDAAPIVEALAERDDDGDRPAVPGPLPSPLLLSPPSLLPLANPPVPPPVTPPTEAPDQEPDQAAQPPRQDMNGETERAADGPAPAPRTSQPAAPDDTESAGMAAESGIQAQVEVNENPTGGWPSSLQP